MWGGRGYSYGVTYGNSGAYGNACYFPNRHASFPGGDSFPSTAFCGHAP